MVNFQSTVPDITLDAVLTRIVEQVPGAKITDEDWYANRRIEEERVIEVLRQKGHPMHFSDEILSSVDRAAHSCGPTKGIMIPMGSSSLKGRISRELMLLHSDTLIDNATTNHLLATLQALGIVKDMQVSDVIVQRKVSGNE